MYNILKRTVFDGGFPMDSAQARPIHPDIIVRYPPDENCLVAPGGRAYAVVYVRPETNNILYERAIISAVRRTADTLYMANLGGGLFARDRILEKHYASQFRFAADPCGEMAKYPEMILRFQAHFQVSFEHSPLIGSFDAAKLLGMHEEDLFETIVPEADFLDCWGQEFKRIFDFIVANPNLPAVLKRYTPGANVLALAVRSRGPDPDFFCSLNQAIYSEIVSHHETPLIDGEKLQSLGWQEKIRRTYHFSTNHLMAMLDMATFVYLDESRRLEVEDTPLGRRLIGEGSITREKLSLIVESPLRYLGREGGNILVYLPSAAAGMSVEQVVEMLNTL